MQRILNIARWLLLALAVTSCLTVEENYTFHTDGSGEMELAFDLKQLAMFVEEGPQRDSLFMMGAIFDEITPKLEELDGVTRIETFEDREAMRLGLRFNFTNVTALNEALSNVLLIESTETHPFFVQEKKTIRRTGPLPSSGFSLVDAVAQSFMGEGADPEEAEMVLGIMKYHTNYHFEKRVKLVYAEAETSVTGAEREDVMISSTFDQLLGNYDQLDAAFVLK
jgi:hypothetical protein